MVTNGKLAIAVQKGYGNSTFSHGSHQKNALFNPTGIGIDWDSEIAANIICR
jgi:hypothetical protein